MMVGHLISKSVHRRNNNNAMLMFLFLIIGLCLLSFATMATAQSSSNFTPGTSNSTSNDITVKQMGICQLGVKSPCNGNSVQ
jgi:hypothetical protein